MVSPGQVHRRKVVRCRATGTDRQQLKAARRFSRMLVQRPSPKAPLKLVPRERYAIGKNPS